MAINPIPFVLAACAGLWGYGIAGAEGAIWGLVSVAAVAALGTWLHRRRSHRKPVDTPEASPPAPAERHWITPSNRE